MAYDNLCKAFEEKSDYTYTEALDLYKKVYPMCVTDYERILLKVWIRMATDKVLDTNDSNTIVLPYKEFLEIPVVELVDYVRKNIENLITNDLKINSTEYVLRTLTAKSGKVY